MGPRNWIPCRVDVPILYCPSDITLGHSENCTIAGTPRPELTAVGCQKLHLNGARCAASIASKSRGKQCQMKRNLQVLVIRIVATGRVVGSRGLYLSNYQVLTDSINDVRPRHDHHLGDVVIAVKVH